MNPVTWDDAQAAHNKEEFIKQQQAADGVKYFCDLGPKSLPPPCVIFSLGSEGDYSFEEAVLRDTACKVCLREPNSQTAL